MAQREVSGGTPKEIEEMRSEHKEMPQFQDHGTPFEVAYCLTRIGKQPDDYDGPDRHCKRRVIKKDPDEYEGKTTDDAAYANSCPFHGGDNEKGGENGKHKLDNPRTAAIKHGLYADDISLMMDFTDEEQELFDRIMEEWPEVYDWPAQEDDPARYRLLRRVAVNEVRALRGEEHIDEVGEVYQEPVFDEQGVEIGSKDTENPVSREYRLLMKEVTNQMRELGLTPKSRQQMDTMEAQEEKDDAVADIADEALGSQGDNEYNPGDFE